MTRRSPTQSIELHKRACSIWGSLAGKVHLAFWQAGAIWQDHHGDLAGGAEGEHLLALPASQHIRGPDLDLLMLVQATPTQKGLIKILSAGPAEVMQHEAACMIPLNPSTSGALILTFSCSYRPHLRQQASAVPAEVMQHQAARMIALKRSTPGALILAFSCSSRPHLEQHASAVPAEVMQHKAACMIALSHACCCSTVHTARHCHATQSSMHERIKACMLSLTRACCLVSHASGRNETSSLVHEPAYPGAVVADRDVYQCWQLGHIGIAPLL